MSEILLHWGPVVGQKAAEVNRFVAFMSFLVSPDVNTSSENIF